MTMGKAADNERIKLRANIYNSLAAGTLLAGVFIPILPVYQAIPKIGDWLLSFFFKQVTAPEFDWTFVSLSAFAIAGAFWAGLGFHRDALREAEQLQD
ncbi:MAG: hypothetical protein NTU64_17460 [Hyphomicrobiales bacterium]|nr:hypothetical protein [Hyphomicrobiales bacterium]